MLRYRSQTRRRTATNPDAARERSKQMRHNIKLVALAVALQGCLVVSAPAQQVNPTTGSPAATVGAVLLPRPAPVVRLDPNGARRSTSISTITVCDFTDFTGSFTSLDDVCSLGAR